MNGKELVAHLRESILDDIYQPQLWTDPELLRMLNYAEVQACRRAHLIIDATTQNDLGTAATASTNGTAGTNGIRSLCWVPIVADQATYNLSPKILQIKRCQLASMEYPLTGPVTYAELDDLAVGWFGTNGTVGTAGSSGYPTFFMNEPNNTLTFVKAPSVSDIARLVISRIPLWPFTLSTSPEIDEQYHVDLCDWAAHLAYLKPDSETLNPSLAKYYEDAFTAKFGTLPDAYIQKTRKVISQKQRMRPREFGR
jgi:hypothetical protein